MKILCCADIHMGRIPSVPYSENLSSHTSWDAIVDKALEFAVDVVLIAGDVVEQEEHWFEAYGPLLSGLEKLGRAGIQVIGVGGNHDYSVFPSLARESPYIKILGLGGKWEHFDYKGVRFIGWSFAERRVSQNPLESFDESLAETDLSLLGVLHCDVGGPPGSSYAPVSLLDFSRSPLPWWVLGHIHKGGVLKGGKAFYCGSPYALDSNEEGPHGIWLMEKEDKGPWEDPKLVQLCPYRFESVNVSLEGIEDEQGVKKALTQTLREAAKGLSFSGTLICSLVLTGVVSRDLRIRDALTKEGLESLYITEGEIVVRPLGSYIDETVLDVDLHQLSQGGGATALLAQKLLDEKELTRMVETYKRLEKESYSASAFSLLHSSHVSKSEDEYRNLTKKAAKTLLFSMLNEGEATR